MRTVLRGLFVCLPIAAGLAFLASCSQTSAPETAPAAASSERSSEAAEAASAEAAAESEAAAPQLEATGAAGALAPMQLEECRTIPVADDGTCPAFDPDEELCQPRVIPAENGVVTVPTMDVAKKRQCVPEFSNGVWSLVPKELRSYGAPDRRTDEMVYSFPGPTFRMRRTSERVQGDRFQMLLTNSLGPTTVEEQMKCDPGNGNPPRFRNDVHPNCIHGGEVTNFHFHGFHISPQPLQDYVLLKLYPENTPNIPNYDPRLTNEQLRKYEEIGGAYRYDLDPLPYNQPEGTHWYHAHHHGATAMQVINGMAGAILVEGPFDDWLNREYGFYPDRRPILQERLFVVQQINDQLASTRTLINGQGDPDVPIRPGEVQRWRFVSATTQASAQLNVQFTGLQVCQIAMDGVQFGPENYRKQPLLEGTASRAIAPCKENATFELSPGNRADFLVRMPIGMEDDDGLIEVMQRVIGTIADEAHEEMGIRLNLPEVTSLLTLKMMEPMPEGSGMKFPLPTLPPLPNFLAPPEPRVSKSIRYQMYKPAGNNPAPVFKIDEMQVRPCVPRKMTLQRGVDEKWTIYNLWNDQPAREEDESGGNRGIAHPFHIHTNPFYVVRDGNKVYDPGIWQDTIALPLVADGDRDPPRASSVELLMEFEDYTGGYVQHCHILGHEDRGMMTLVQTLCPNGKFGTPHPNRPDACEIPRDPLPICPN